MTACPYVSPYGGHELENAWASPHGGSWPHLMVGLDELAHLMVASLQRSWCNRVSSYDGHQLRVLRILLRLPCAVHCVSCLTFSQFLVAYCLPAGF
jgi:L-lactate utilization protein LutB